jgi:hypothetical protein
MGTSRRLQMKRLWFLGLIFGLTACATAAAGTETATKPTSPSAASLPDLGLAPELTNEIWLNVDSPLRLADLRGKVVAIDMWTFG